MIISPISYPGNKSKLLKQLCLEIPKDIDCFVDVFCGSGLVAVNSGAKNLVCNDISVYAIDLLKYFYENNSESVIQDVENIIRDYGLTYSRIMPKGIYVEKKHEGLSLYNKEAFNKLKDDYNKNPKIEKLFVLLIYGFNHYIRFNGKGFFNVPVGKVDFSKSIYDNTKNFVDGIKKMNFRFSNKDFRDMSLYESSEAVYYFDPPYLITKAPYNLQWSVQDDIDLMKILDMLNERGIKFILSNVFLSNGKVNERLIRWSENYFVVNMRRQYLNANYQKKNITKTTEVLIKNF